MRTIQFKESQKEIWNKFIAENSSESFLQAWEWGEFNCVLGRKVWRIGIIDDELLNKNKSENTEYDLLAVALIVKYDLPFGQSYLYCPRGPVINKSKVKSQKSKVIDFLFSEIRKIVKEEKAMFLKIDPPIKMNQESEVPPLSKGVGGIFKNFKKSSSEIQPRNTLILDLTKSGEDLLKEMKPKARYNIRLAERKNVDIEYWILDIKNHKCFGEKFEKFWELVKETSRRDKFASHNKDYYRKMLESLNGKHSFGNPPSPLCQRGDFQEGNNFAGMGLQPVPNISQANKKEETSKQKKLVANQFPHAFLTLTAKLYLAEYKNKIIAANITLSFGDFCVYLHGASSSEYRNVMAPYLLQWQQILDAKKTGCKAYDFWGIENSQKSIKSKVHKVKNDWSGITKFKKGFGGKERSYIGAYDLVFNWKKYYAYKVFRKVKTISRSTKRSV